MMESAIADLMNQRTIVNFEQKTIVTPTVRILQITIKDMVISV